MKTIRDAVHGDMQFDALEMALIDTPQMQRLRGIKQLGASSLVFPSAVHTRFEHSLGTCWLVKRMLESLHRAGHSISAEDRRTACLAALLHDVTHVPFGHTFEDERRLFERHDEDAGRLDFFLQQPGVLRVLTAVDELSRVRSVLTKTPGAPEFVRQLVSGTVCADLLDYLQRDALFCGLALRYDERLFQLFYLADGRLAIRLHKDGGFRRDALSELIHLLQMRYALTERVYYHHAKTVAGAMVSRALELALEARAIAREDLYTLRDDSLLDRLAQAAPQVPGMADVIDDLQSRRLYKRIYMLAPAGFGRPGLAAADRETLATRYHQSPAQRRLMERRLAERLGIPESNLIVYCPSAAMALKEADVLVQVAPGVVQPLAELGHPDVAGLQEKHAGVWKFFVCLRRDHAARFAEAGRICEEIFGHSNQLQPQSRADWAYPVDARRL